MSEVTTLRADAVFSSGDLRAAKYTFKDIPASETDYEIITAIAGKKFIVLAAAFLAGSTATTITFNTKGSGAGTAISCAFANDINGGAALPYCPVGWFQTSAGEALTATTGAGATTGVQIVYIETV